MLALFDNGEDNITDDELDRTTGNVAKYRAENSTKIS